MLAFVLESVCKPDAEAERKIRFVVVKTEELHISKERTFGFETACMLQRQRKR